MRLRRHRLDHRGLRSFLARFDVEADGHAVEFFEVQAADRIPVKIDFCPVVGGYESIAFVGKEFRDDAPLGGAVTSML